MAYDSAILTFTVKTNKVDLVDAAHINLVQTEVNRIETILGTLLKGTATDLSTRIGKSLDPDGSILSGAAFPSPALASQAFWKTDDILYVRNTANSAWIAMAQGTGHAFSAYHSGDQAISGDTELQVLTDTENFDTAGDFASSTFTCPVTGKYLFTLGGQFSCGGTGKREIETYLKVNGTKVGNIGGFYSATSNSGDIGGFSGALLLSLTATDTVTVFIKQTGSSSDATLKHGTTLTRFTGTQLA